VAEPSALLAYALAQVRSGQQILPVGNPGGEGSPRLCAGISELFDPGAGGVLRHARLAPTMAVTGCTSSVQSSTVPSDAVIADERGERELDRTPTTGLSSGRRVLESHR
jgi:hypothetical protein